MSPPGPACHPESLPERPGPLRMVDVRHYDGALVRKVSEFIADHLVNLGLADPSGRAGHVRLKLGVRHIPPSTLNGLFLAIAQHPKEFEETNHRKVTSAPAHKTGDHLIAKSVPSALIKGEWQPKQPTLTELLACNVPRRDITMGRDESVRKNPAFLFKRERDGVEATRAALVKPSIPPKDARRMREKLEENKVAGR